MRAVRVPHGIKWGRGSGEWEGLKGLGSPTFRDGPKRIWGGEGKHCEENGIFRGTPTGMSGKEPKRRGTISAGKSSRAGTGSCE